MHKEYKTAKKNSNCDIKKLRHPYSNTKQANKNKNLRNQRRSIHNKNAAYFSCVVSLAADGLGVCHCE